MRPLPGAANSRALLIHRAISAILWIIFLVVVARQTYVGIHTAGTPIVGNDFRAFYCGGEAVLKRVDPYLVEPLRTCEHAIQRGTDLPAQYVTPTPQPGYTLGFFSLLALMPYTIAAYFMYFLVLAACIAIAIIVEHATRKQTADALLNGLGVPSGAVALALLTSGVFASGFLGQITPLCAVGVALAGLALVHRRYTLAAIAAGIALIEPHTGVATAVALFCFAPRTRIPLAVIALALAAISFAAIGIHANIEYFTRVLSEHARAELFAGDQYSLSHLLVRYTTDNVALAVGSLSFILMLAIGIVLARKAARAFESDACIAYVPAAATLLGGTFLHESQLIVALPAAFLFAMRGRGIVAFAGRFLVIVVTAVPFTVLVEHSRNTFLLAASTAILASLATVHLRPVRENVARLAIISMLLTAFAIGLPFFGAPLSRIPIIASHSEAVMTTQPRATATRNGGVANATGANDQASVNWGAYLRSNPAYALGVPGSEMAKASFWLALVLLLGIIALPQPASGSAGMRYTGPQAR